MSLLKVTYHLAHPRRCVGDDGGGEGPGGDGEAGGLGGGCGAGVAAAAGVGGDDEGVNGGGDGEVGGGEGFPRAARSPTTKSPRCRRVWSRGEAVRRVSSGAK
nr:hypothetical protein B0A51_17269 [Rachicladosporium sp. CCFEE 5018]